MPNNVAASTITNALSTLLSAVSQIQQVEIGLNFDYSGGFPFCAIYYEGMSNPIEDNQSYFRTYRFAIDVVQEITNKSKQNAELDFQAACDAVVATLETNWQMAGVQNSVVERGDAKTSSINSAPVRVMHFVLTVQTLYTI